MKLRDKLLIKNYFKEYYFKNVDKIANEINEIDSREFAYIDFDGGMRRHIALTKEVFHKWVVDVVPRDFYHSSAYYLFPDKEMGQKDWQGGDLIFDIDLDHIKTYKPEEIILCRDSEVTVVDREEDCHSGKINKIVFIDEKGIEMAKRELIRLIELLVRDFDFKLEDINIYFSGGRGFHVHISRENVLEFDSYVRMEIKDYITLDGFDIFNITSFDNRVIDEFRKMLNMNSKTLNEVFSLDELTILKNIFSKGASLKKLRKEINRNLREKINRFIIDHIGVSIDGVVTVDTSRLIRTPYSMHGKTGLIKIRIDYSDLDNFNPFTNAIRSDESMMQLHVYYLPEVFWHGEYYGPVYNEKIKVPFSLGIYLISRGLGYGGRRV